MNRLRSLYLNETGVNDAGLANLPGLPALRELNLSSTLISNAGMRAAGADSRRSTLDLGGTRVTGAQASPNWPV